ncbi:CsgG/HfaB family protein [Desulforhopalus sp. 52FAK]
MKRLLLLGICLILLPTLLLAENEVQIFEINGTGITRSEAIQNGLIDALQQAKGVTIDARKTFAKSIQQINRSGTETNAQQVMVSSMSSGLVKEATRGVIQEYRVLEASQDDTGEWLALLEVTLHRYKTPGISPHSRRKIAVIPFYTSQQSYAFNKRWIPSWKISNQLSQKIVTELTQSRKFSVLDREYTTAFLQERNFVLSPNSPTAEHAKAGEALGVDYLLLGSVTDAKLVKTIEKVPVINEIVYDFEGTVIADYRIMVMATRQVKWADTVSVVLDGKKLAALSKSDSPEVLQQTLLNYAAEMIVQRAMENIYPIRIAKITPAGETILNQGGSSVSPGEILDVFVSGDTVIDQYTGESLGQTESWVGKLQIVRVIPKMSYANIIEGSLENIKQGFICRRAALAQTYTPDQTTQGPPKKKLQPKW